MKLTFETKQMFYKKGSEKERPQAPLIIHFKHCIQLIERMGKAPPSAPERPCGLPLGKHYTLKRGGSCAHSRSLTHLRPSSCWTKAHWEVININLQVKNLTMAIFHFNQSQTFMWCRLFASKGLTIRNGRQNSNKDSVNSATWGVSTYYYKNTGDGPPLPACWRAVTQRSITTAATIDRELIPVLYVFNLIPTTQWEKLTKHNIR